MASDPRHPPPIAIRRARPEDAATLTRVAHAAKRHWGYPDEWIRLWSPDLTVTPAACAGEPFYCAVEVGEIRGFYGLSNHGAAFELEHMWVEPRHMGRGIGARLFRHALETARELGGTTLEIASDPNAEGFYARLGARRAGERAATPPGRTLPLLAVDLR